MALAEDFDILLHQRPCLDFWDRWCSEGVREVGVRDRYPPPKRMTGNWPNLRLNLVVLVEGFPSGEAMKSQDKQVSKIYGVKKHPDAKFVVPVQRGLKEIPLYIYQSGNCYINIFRPKYILSFSVLDRSLAAP